MFKNVQKLNLVLYFSISVIHVVSSKTLINRNQWYETPYLKSTGCFQEGSMISVPRLEDFAAVKSCYQQLPEVRKTNIQSLRTKEAAKARKLNLVTYNNVTTPDGYMLTVFRITGYENEKPGPRKPSVLLVHPLASSPDVWFILPGNKSLVNKLVAAGYDCWLPATRGTRYSLGHITLNANSPTDLKYWDFSMHEVGIYDIPTVINLILKETGNKKIFYVGHSVSSNYDAIARAVIPELNEKIHASFWMGATLYTGHSRTFHKLFNVGPGKGLMSELLTNMTSQVTRGRTPLGNKEGQSLLFRFCVSTPLACGLCGTIYSAFVGFDATQINYADLFRMIFVGDSFSLKMATHLGQNARVCRFQKYDYGATKNYKLYGQPYPPLYNLSNVRSPVYMYYSDNDMITTPMDQQMTRDALPPGTVKGFLRLKWKYFNHLSFHLNNNADTVLFDSIVNIINGYTNKGINM